jgi:hypothetical protein
MWWTFTGFGRLAFDRALASASSGDWTPKIERNLME